jgi:hypothetical protein
MKYAHLKFILLVILGLMIPACNKTDKNIEQTKTVEEKDSTSNRDLTHFLFLTEWFGKTGVYRYDLSKKKYSPVWWHPRENVVMLTYRPDNMPAYFFTAGKIGTKGNFPFFERVKLFRISRHFSETIQIDRIKEGLQFTTRWNDDNNLEFIFTSVDKVISSYVNQYTKVYDFYGKLIDSKIETFDIEKSGFPYLMPQRNSTISPSAKYGISVLSDSLFLKTAGNDSAKFITVIKHSLNKIKWNEVEQFLFISTLNLNSETVKTKKPETSELIIYSLAADSLIEVFGGAGVKNFFTRGDLLIFDDGFGKNSKINIYNLEELKIVDIVQTKEGCGLVVIPTL